MKYPNIIFFRYPKYSDIDKFFIDNEEVLNCTIKITNDKDELNKLYSSDYHLLITYGNENEYICDVNSIICDRMRLRWLHYNGDIDLNTFNSGVNFCYIHNVIQNNEKTRVIFSIFTTCYNSYEKIMRAYNSIKKQTFKDWEWVILDDSHGYEHFQYLNSKLAHDKRIRLFKKGENSGNIGNVKNEVVSLCRGKYLIEMDHDDEILPNTLKDAVLMFESDSDIGFVYMNCINLFENGENFFYGGNFALGYSGYYCEKYNEKWVYVSSMPNINNITLAHIVGVPNHPRIWKKDALLKMGNYSEFLPICDDYELILRTAINTKMAKMNKFSYIQYMNNNGNNFSLIRNGEINRLCPHHIRPQFYNTYKIHDKMRELEAYEDEKYIFHHPEIWKRDEPDYEHKYCNKIINYDYKKQYCIIGIDYLNAYIERITELYNDPNNDFLVLDNKFSTIDICNELDRLRFCRMKCYSPDNCTKEQLIKFFLLIYKSCDDYDILMF